MNPLRSSVGPRGVAARRRPAAHRRPNTRLALAPLRPHRRRCEHSTAAVAGPVTAPTSPPVSPEFAPTAVPADARPCSTRTRHAARATTCLGARRWRRLVLVAELLVLALLITAAASPSALAAGPTVATNIADVFTNIRNWLMGILAGLALVFLTIGGVRYLLGSGDPGEVEKAKSAIKAAAIGFCLAALAPVILSILQGLVA